MDSDRFDLAVVGAGLNGSLLALAAGEAGLSTVLIDRMPLKSFTDAGFDGRTTAIASTSHRLFAALGIWPDLADQARCSCISITARPHPRVASPSRWDGSSRTVSCARPCCDDSRPARRSS